MTKTMLLQAESEDASRIRFVRPAAEAPTDRAPRRDESTLVPFVNPKPVLPFRQATIACDTSKCVAAKLSVATVPWIDAGAPRLTIAAKAVFSLDDAELRPTSTLEPLLATELAELDRGVRGRLVLRREDPSLCLTMEDSFLRIDNLTAASSKRISLPRSAVARLVAKSGAALDLDLWLKSIRLHAGGRELSLTWCGLASVRPEELHEVTAGLSPPVSAPDNADDSVRAAVLRVIASGKALRGLALAGADLHGIDLKAANLDGLDLSRANLDEANLSGASLRNAVCEGTTFRSSSLRGANLDSLRADGAEFGHADLEGADLRRGCYIDCAFAEANLRRTLGMGAAFEGCRMEGADLREASLRESKLRRSDLRGAKLDAADLRDADLEGSNLSNASRRGARLAGAKTRGVIEND